jgi:2-oxoglutarate dehydrogenase E2 component (dihydrolipoamide succinyltransferase)
MSVDIKAPEFPESISEGTVAAWLRAPGDRVARDEVLVEIETDKVVIEVVAPDDGVLTEILLPTGETVQSEQVIGRFTAGTAGAAGAAGTAGAAVTATTGASSPSAEPPAVDGGRTSNSAAHSEAGAAAAGIGGSASPAARKLADERGIDIRKVAGSGRAGRVTKEDVVRMADAPAGGASAQSVPVAEQVPALNVGDGFRGERVERRVPMTRLRASIARRLVEAQHTAAMLTTFNEVDMSGVIALRTKYQETFQARHNGTRIGYMSFFVRAAVEALKRFPSVNASLDGNDVVYHGYFDIGVAVSTERGLVVPVVRDADALGLAQIEDQINDFGRRARDGKLTIEDMTGGTFTISNGGIFGSLLSTPILNPPQTGILGMHKIQDRPVVVDGQVVVRPMMYLALSYDHRLIDGQEAVRFLVAIKDMLEDPARILLEL